MILSLWTDPNAGITIFGIQIQFVIIMYVFLILAGSSLIVYLINFFVKRDKLKRAAKTNDEEFIKINENEIAKRHIDNEIFSVIKDRHEQKTIKERK